MGTHHKYGYNDTEMFFMVITTALTNLSCVPGLMLVYRRKMIHQVFIGLFAALTSFMYHLSESLDTNDLGLTELQWHKLDNIGSIGCFCSLFVYLMDNQDPFLDAQLNYLSLGIAMILQEANPWNIHYSIGPLLFYIVLFVFFRIFRKNKRGYNYNMFCKGLFIYALAIPCFYFALDEFKDYLRIAHGVWHLFLGWGSFYLWQANSRPHEVMTMKETIFKSGYVKIQSPLNPDKNMLDNSEGV